MQCDSCVHCDTLAFHLNLNEVHTCHFCSVALGLVVSMATAGAGCHGAGGSVRGVAALGVRAAVSESAREEGLRHCQCEYHTTPPGVQISWDAGLTVDASRYVPVQQRFCTTNDCETGLKHFAHFFLQGLPESCLPRKQLTTWQSLRLWLSWQLSWSRDPCEEYHRALMVDPFWEVTPVMVSVDCTRGD